MYLARHILTDAPRAVKVSGQNREGRSVHELNMLKHVHHDSLPGIIDVFQENGVVCLVMEYVEGTALSEYTIRGGADGQFFFGVAEQLLDTLEYLHTGRMPVLHLDVKPSNILIHADGRLTLLDLGAAMPFRQEEGAAHSCLGTPGYAAPEQFDRRGRPDVRTDLYGFGATMFLLLTGERYKKRQTGGKNDRYPRSERGIFRFFRSLCWRGRMRKLLLACLEEDQEKRPGSAAAVRKRLLRIKKQREFERSVRQTGIAVLMLAGVLTLAWMDTGELAAGGGGRRKEFEKLLQKAELAGSEQAAQLYRQAILTCPKEILPYQEFVARAADDCVFSLEEEQTLQMLMDITMPLEKERVFDQLERNSEEFGRFAYDLGIAYWYFYEGTGGRTAAAGWFAKAAEDIKSEEEKRGWVREARIYGKIGSYYEKLGKRDITGEDAADSAVYWRDLSQLCQIELSQGEEAGIARKNLFEEMLNLLIFESAKLRSAGIEKEELQSAIEEIRAEGGQDFFSERCEEAAKAVERAYEEAENEQQES